MTNILSQIVEVCVFRKVKTEPQYLLLQRADKDKLYPGIWQIVTGTIKRNENAMKAVLRELKEETDLRIKKLWTAPVVDSYFDRHKDAVQLVPVFAAEADDFLEVCLSPEHQRYVWLSYPSARKRLVWPGQQNVLDIVHEFITGGKEAAGLLEITKF